MNVRCPQCHKPLAGGKLCSCRFLSTAYLARLDRLDEVALRDDDPEFEEPVRDSFSELKVEWRILFPNREGEDD